MGQGKGSNRAFNNYKKPNIDHFAHQKNVTGVGAHKNAKKYSRKEVDKMVKRTIQDELTRDNTLAERADHIPNEPDDRDDEE
jgi:hypothetical protein